ncbi:bifunctional PIG-L family deacetylase/class I SAM-dependent methyltransferase [Luteococcus sp. H138]|uniref:bifunctional PIG-L family deacetylase/class I SAM-dependent methyltransferase n=1 Tax=unclassified Luteococcus TaxID=2639923 RepID=UPI00313DCBDE
MPNAAWQTSAASRWEADVGDRWSAAAAGRPEGQWLTTVPWDELPVVDLTGLADRFDRIVVLSAHPDDETLGLGATLAALAATGPAIEVVVATRGEASHPHSPCISRAGLAEVRGDELTAALDELGLAPAEHWGLPDGRLGEADTNLALQALVDDLLQRHRHERLLLAAPWSHDGHADHDALGWVAQAAADDAAVACVSYPVWLWHWGTDEDLPVADLVLSCPGAEALHRRARALDCFESQHTPFGRAPGAGPVLTSQARQRAARVAEVLIDPDGVLPHRRVPGAVAPGEFDAMFEHGDDPWHVETSWYEARRQALVEAILPHETLGRVLDLGCSTGRLTAALAARAREVVAVDHSAEALRVARDRHITNVEWRQGSLSSVLPELEGPFDLVVLSEVGYFLDGAALLATLSAVTSLLEADGTVLAAHWRRPTREIPLDGRLVEAQVDSLWPTTARYTDDDVTITLSAPHRPVAPRGGL